jgi:galactitol-specific phosphotransferase system IIC component
MWLKGLMLMLLVCAEWLVPCMCCICLVMLLQKRTSCITVDAFHMYHSVAIQSL